MMKLIKFTALFLLGSTNNFFAPLNFTNAASRSKGSKGADSSDNADSSNLNCRGVLNEFNSDLVGFGSKSCGLTRTSLAGTVMLLANPLKSFVIDEHVCVADCIGILDTLVGRADTAGGCDKYPVAAQPVGALQQYREDRDIAVAITKMLCTNATECWKVVHGLTLPECWNGEFNEPILDKKCIANATCGCLDAYVIATNDLSRDGWNAFGASEETRKLVKNRAKENACHA